VINEDWLSSREDKDVFDEIRGIDNRTRGIGLPSTDLMEEPDIYDRKQIGFKSTQGHQTTSALVSTD